MSENKPKKRGRPPKAKSLKSTVSENGNGLQLPKRKRGRPPKATVEAIRANELERLEATSLRQKNLSLSVTPQDEIHEVSNNLNVNKTYKLYIGGAFPRTESGRFLQLHDNKKMVLANYCRASRKDFRNSVVAARKAFSGWASRPAFNRSQIIYFC